MLENERYQDAVKKDKTILEAQKSQWEIEREEVAKNKKILRSVAITLFAFYGTLLVLLFVIQIMSNYDLMYADKFLLYGGRNDRHKGIFHA